MVSSQRTAAATTKTTGNSRNVATVQPSMNACGDPIGAGWVLVHSVVAKHTVVLLHCAVARRLNRQRRVHLDALVNDVLVTL